MASSFALSLLVISPATQRGLDIVLLPSLSPAAKQDDQHLAVPAKINSWDRD